MDFLRRIESPDKQNIFSQEGYFIWCNTVTRGKSGIYHGFFSRWEKEKGFDAWLTDSRIIRCEARNPEGPFVFKEELSCLNAQPWAEKMVHNPTVLAHGGKYYLFYGGTTFDPATVTTKGNGSHPARFNQRIGLAVADQPEGPWHPSAMNPILSPREGEWDSSFVNNPAVMVDDDGTWMMIYKAKWSTDNRLILGLATSSAPEGPYVRTGPAPLFHYDVEDPFIWKEDGKYYILAKDMSGDLVKKHDGILFTSENGVDWALNEPHHAWSHDITWADDGKAEHFPFMERPQLYIENGKPVCMYTAVGDWNSYSYNIARRLKADSSD